MQDEERDGTLGEVIDRRVQVYGNPVETFARIAEVWSGILGHTVNATDVPLMMAGMKLVRAQVMPDYSDNSDDIDGYIDIFRKIVGEDMIHARTVNEFIEKKWGRPEPERPLVDKDECLHWNKHLAQADHTEAECPVEQSIPFKLSEYPVIRVCKEHGYPVGMCGRCRPVQAGDFDLKPEQS